MCDVIDSNYILTCNKGDIVTYDNQKYYVLNDSSSDTYYVTLLKKDFLTANEINQYSNNYVSINGEYPFCYSFNCNDNNYTGCNSEHSNYDLSNIREIINGWSGSYNGDLMYVDGYEARLLNEEELIENFSPQYGSNNNINNYNQSSNTPSFLFKLYLYWSMAKGNYTGVLAGNSDFYIYSCYNKNNIRPVINLKKNKIESGCGRGNINEEYDYNMGDEVNYNNNSYCVLSKSKSNDDYVTLIKKDALTYDELVEYNNNYELYNKTLYYNPTISLGGMMQYYKSDTCNTSQSSYITTGCNNNYDSSFVKDIVNNWSNSFSNDLKEVDGYKARLINIDEMESMGLVRAQYVTTGLSYSSNEIENECLKTTLSYWTMAPNGDKNSQIGVIGNGSSDPRIDSFHTVRPVINLKKCALGNTCE